MWCCTVCATRRLGNPVDTGKSCLSQVVSHAVQTQEFFLNALLEDPQRILSPKGAEVIARSRRESFAGPSSSKKLALAKRL